MTDRERRALEEEIFYLKRYLSNISPKVSVYAQKKARLTLLRKKLYASSREENTCA